MSQGADSSMAPPERQGPWLNHLDGLLAHFRTMIDIEGFGENDKEEKIFLKILQDTIEVVRNAEKQRARDLSHVVERAHAVISEALKYAYHEPGNFESVPLFAYSSALPKVTDSLQMAGSDIIESFMDFYTRYLQPGAPRPELPDFAKTKSWIASPRPYPQSTRLSRFRDNTPASPSSATPLAQSVFQARAQLSVGFLKPPLAMSISSGGSILAMSLTAGYRDYNPVLTYYRLPDSDWDLKYGQHAYHMEPGLSSFGNHLTTDEDRSLIWMADHKRVKSFSWANTTDNDDPPTKLPNVHTLNCGDEEYKGPIAVLPGGRLARAGKGRAAIWNIDALETHQDLPAGAHLGGTFDPEGSWRNKRPIELSAGSVPYTVVAFADDTTYEPMVWHYHSDTGHLLCGERQVETQGYSCVALDLNDGGRRAARYLGHGHDVEHFATSAGDPNVFWTSCADGAARMFDVRRPLPVLTLVTESNGEACADVVWVHPDGIPALFTGAERSQQVKLWDIRSRACVYELSTGNNGVKSMVWHDRLSQLIVATERGTGYGAGAPNSFRAAKIPPWATRQAVKDAANALNNVVNTASPGASQPEANEPNSPAVRSAPLQRDCEDDEEASISDSGSEEEGEGEDEDEESEDDDEGSQDEDYESDSAEEMSEDQEDDPDDIDEQYSKDKRWITRAFHNERFFGYAYDAGTSVLMWYQFREKPDWRMPHTWDAWNSF